MDDWRCAGATLLEPGLTWSLLNHRVTPLLLTYNEAPNIRRTLERLTWAERVVVIDSGSTDQTVELARRFTGTEIFTRPFDDLASQWNFGHEKVQSEWVLSLDADYVLGSGFEAEMFQRIEDSQYNGYKVTFRYCIQGMTLRNSLYPPRVILYRRSGAKYVQEGHAQRLILPGEVGALRIPIYHDDRKSLRRWLEEQRKYADKEAQRLIQNRGVHLDFVDRARRTGWILPLFMPFYCLVWKRLLLDGKAGWIYTLQRIYAEVLLALKILEGKSRTHEVSNEEDALPAL